MAAHALTEARRPAAGHEDVQLGLYERQRKPRRAAPRPAAPLCAGCREKEARYGFREADAADRPRTLCFTCFRMELDRRQRLAAQLARGWNAAQVGLPLAETLHQLDLRRRRAQIKARRIVGS